MMVQFESMPDGHLGCISGAKHGIELKTESVRPLHRASYRAGPFARVSDKTEIDKILRTGGIELAETEWSTDIVSAPEKAGCSASCRV